MSVHLFGQDDKKESNAPESPIEFGQMIAKLYESSAFTDEEWLAKSIGMAILKVSDKERKTEHDRIEHFIGNCTRQELLKMYETCKFKWGPQPKGKPVVNAAET